MTDKKRDAVRRLGKLFDDIDAEARQPGEPSLRSVVAAHAREQLEQDSADRGSGDA